MDDQEKSQYTVELTPTSKIFFYEVVEYIYQHHPADRAEEIARELKQTAKSLNHNPNRGTAERRLKRRPQNYQFVLYHRTKRSDIKIIYYVDETNKMVYVTDFFPTEKDDMEMVNRNK